MSQQVPRLFQRKVPRRRLLAGLGLWPLTVACGLGGAKPAPKQALPHIEAATAKDPLRRDAATGKVVFLDPGHGGIDWGGKARKPDGTWVAEKTYTLDIGLRTAALLRTAGYKVELARTGEPGPDQWPVNNPPRDLNGDGEIDGIDDVQARVTMANAAHADLLLSIHLNGHALPNGDVDPTFSGATTLYDPDRTFAAENQRFATLVQRETLDIMAKLLGHPTHDWGIADDTKLATPFTTSHTTYNHDVELGPSEPHWIVASEMPGVISEPLFLSNPEEQAALLQDASRQQLATAYLKAIDAFFGRTA
jgi:N-acetylmuramoyl-L-alanine amidase